MNLKKLFDLQKALDERIVREKGLEGQELLPQKILALQVELGECANEWRGFKFWSKDQNPRNSVEHTCKYCRGTGVDMGVMDCKKCAGEGGFYSNPLLEEYVDCLHFILSIGIEGGALGEFDFYKTPVIANGIVNQFLYMNSFLNDYFLNGDWHDYEAVVSYFLGLGEMLGFTWEQIEAAYIAKNEVNHERQATGY